MAVPVAARHAEWLGLVDVTGPFLTVSVLKQAMPHGLDPDPPGLARRIGVALEELESDPGLRHGWLRFVLEEVLEHDGAQLLADTRIPASCRHALPEHGVHLAPDLVLADADGGAPRLLVCSWPPGQALDGRVLGSGWPASPRERAAELCRRAGVPLALVTDGRFWCLVHARAGETVGFGTWDAAWWQAGSAELRSFAAVLGRARLFGVPDHETTEALLRRSADAQQEVTDQLGTQVRHAVELLVSELDRADQEAGGALLGGEVANHEVYEAAVTVMMRLVFCFFAEERGLLALDEPRYAERYAASTLRAQLQEQADQDGEDTLDTRTTAWHRLLALFRAVHAGVGHDELRLRAYGGALFDPDRFAFLEGRPAGSTWRTTPARPLAISDRSVLHVLSALQVLRPRGLGAAAAPQRLSYRALDVEQVGHVYEGLLDHDAVRTHDPALGFAGRREEELGLDELEAQRAAAADEEAFGAWLAGATGLTVRQVQAGLDAEADAQADSLLRIACANDAALTARARPYLALLRTDLRGLPVVYRAGGIYVTTALDRRSSGSYYTPRALAEEVVRHALDPLVYAPGPAQTADTALWRLRAPDEILALNVCDMAMGSGAFLVGACRHLASRLQEAWAALGDGRFTVTGRRADDHPGELVVPADAEERETLARRLVADRCLYGVDRNPMAVDMAKLSLWLVTMARDRPFSFLDHALRAGDALLGIAELGQLDFLHLDRARGNSLHGRFVLAPDAISAAIGDARARRERLEALPVLDPSDAERKALLLAEAQEATARLSLLADGVIGATLATTRAGDDALDRALARLADDATAVLAGDPEATDRVRDAAAIALRTDAPSATAARDPLHWPIEFPEVFAGGGFDAIVGNPPFLGGKRITGTLGTAYRDVLVRWIAGDRRGSADLVAYFVLRAAQVLRPGGMAGLLATNTIAQGDTREVALDHLLADGFVAPRAVASRPWPGGASLEVSHIWLREGKWCGAVVLDDEPVNAITPSLEAASRVTGPAHRLAAAGKRSFIGCFVNGIGFVLADEEALALLDRDPRNAEVVRPYLVGEDLNGRPDGSPSRWVIDFRDWPVARAEKYPDCLAIVRERVKPGRDRVNRATHRDLWWRFGDTRMELRRAIAGLERAIVITSVSKVVQPMFASTRSAFSHMLAVFAYDDDAHFGLLSSGFHWWWAVTRASTLETRVRYTPSDCFDTFPQPDLTDAVGVAGGALEAHRAPLMLDRGEGLTKTYNRVHDPGEHAADIAELRRLHVALDHAVRDAYGWTDLDLGHGFHETRQGVRHTFAPGARQDVLDRLLELNHARYAEELRIGLHARKPKRASRRPGPGAGQLPLGER